jgi:molybdenum cofactor cytidylyltransferase
VGAVQNAGEPVSELRQRVAAVVLAAGGSARMPGETKQLLPWADTTLVRNAVNIAEQAHLADLVVVTGNQAEQVEKQVKGSSARVIHNPAWAAGRASSVRAAVRALGPEIAAAIFINADQPFLTSQVLGTIVDRFAAEQAPIVVPTYDGKMGSPVLFARAHFDELDALEGDHGGRELLTKYLSLLDKVAIADTRAAVDLDTPEDYRAALSEIRAAARKND